MIGDLTGQRFGRLIVIGEKQSIPRVGRHWRCKCDCGNECVRSTSKLRDKAHINKSCGCARRDSIARASAAAWKVTTKFSHPLKHKLKWMISNMIRRCHVPGSRRYERYGARGISVCDEWRYNRTAFFEWAVANGVREDLSIERIDLDGNYCPENCRFATAIEQQNNTSRNRFLAWDGKIKTLAQWARELGVRPQAMQHRVARSWNIERIFTQPFRRVSA